MLKKPFYTDTPREGFTTKSGSALPRVVPTTRFHEYVPGETPVHIDNTYWGGLSLNIFHFPASNEGVAAPGIPGCGLAYYDRGGAEKAYYGYDGSPWMPHSIRQNTFQLVDSRCGPKWQWELDEAAGPFTAINLILEPDLIYKTAYEALGVSRLEIRFDNRVGAEDGLVAALSKVLKKEAQSQTPFGRIYGETAAQLLAVHLIKNYSSINWKLPPHNSGLSRSQLSTVLEYLEANLHRDISLDSMSRLCGLSPYYFARMFKISTGMPPHRYVIRQRMDRAARLLKHTRLSILDIALQIGYQSPSHFSMLFKKCYGATPTSYRRAVLGR